MKTLAYLATVLAGLLLTTCSPTHSRVATLALTPSMLLDQLAIDVTPAENREFSFTDKQSGYYYATTHANEQPAWHAGWNIATHRVLHDYELLLDGTPLDRQSARVRVYPYKLQRTFAAATEELYLYDNQRVVGIQLTNVNGQQLTWRPAGDLTTVEADAPEGLWLIPKEAPTHRILVAPWQPAAITVQNGALSTAAASGGFVLVYGHSKDEARALLGQFRAHHEAWLQQRRRRMNTLVANTNPIATNSPQLDKALPWLLLTTDELVTNQQGWGIYAGLPWFNDYWGRDLFISLPGACLVTGQFETAKKILLSFAKFQNLDPTSKDYGRVPNRARPDDIIYNTTDGTPRFVIEMLDYLRYSGDTAAIREFYPAVKRAAEGSLKYWVDAHGYLTHDDADTWMDAKIKNVTPLSPRGNRANDIQALWYEQLQASAQLADYLHDDASARQWRAVAAKVKQQFPQDFFDAQHPHMADRLTATGQRDFQLRPNQLYAYSLVPDPARRMQLTKLVWQELVYPWGVASLSQHDLDFHPYHENWHYYHKDAAYHNGTVWLWNNGMAMQRMLEENQPDIAYQLFERMNHQALAEGAVGSLSENADALPRPGQTRGKPSGTFLQAWSNAEQLRVWYQYFLGIRPDMLRNEVVVRPCLPSALTDVAFAVAVGAGQLRAHYQTGATSTYSVQAVGVALTMRFSLPGFEEVAVSLPAGATLQARHTGATLEVTVVDQHGKTIQQLTRTASPTLQAQLQKQNIFFEGTHFAVPYLQPNLKSLSTYHEQAISY
ncbi:amylo-alpha-1,6-glucosidase [Hymenobacter profundi]|uniref:Glycogen debranching enzyme C-terminal domain-containing protein n=1 Tax=Hymenobacter profundi TaxID=1982110 RepID=A0ABS6X4I6_9BACT|nr:amylo-alpha-1,6-glucosidase [Hymenobacter profundi]MBW3130732.1 hypothetical protein [Hymenobacter profundi]